MRRDLEVYSELLHQLSHLILRQAHVRSTVILSQFLQMKKLKQREIKGLTEDHMARDGRVLGSLILTFLALSTTLTYRCFFVTHSTAELPSLTVRFPAAAEEAFCPLCCLTGRAVWEEN